MDLSICGCRGDLISNHRQHISDSGHSKTHLDIRLEKFINFPQILELSLDAPKLTKSFDVLSLELFFEKIDPFQDFLDLGVIGVPVDAVGKEKAIKKTVRFD